MSERLEKLDVLFDDLEIDKPTDCQLQKMYKIYCDEVCSIIFENECIKVNKNKSRHPICKGKHQTFEHLITRTSKYSGKRNFDNQRVNRIHWIKPIVENYKSSKIKYFEERNKGNQLQYFFFYEDKNFVVIIRKLPNEKVLITAFCVDDFERNKFKNKYKRYKKTPLRK